VLFGYLNERDHLGGLDIFEDNIEIVLNQIRSQDVYWEYTAQTNDALF